jgi:GTPase SAR1 family protein
MTSKGGADWLSINELDSECAIPIYPPNVRLFLAAINFHTPSLFSKNHYYSLKNKSLSMGNETSKPQSDTLKDSDIRVDQAFQDIFRKGVNINMKVVIRGSSKSGKTSLFRSLQGKKVKGVYKSTPQIQAAMLNWKYDDSPDVVKLDVWDVVDNASAASMSTSSLRKTLSSSFRSTESKRSSMFSGKADASIINVYSGTDGVILMFDPHDEGSINYAYAEIVKVPEHIPVLVVANFCDKNESMLDFSTLQSHLPKLEASRRQFTRLVVGSVVEGTGLDSIKNFLDLTYLNLKCAVTKKTLEVHHEALTKCQERFEGGAVSVSAVGPEHTVEQKEVEKQIERAIGTSVNSGSENMKVEDLEVMEAKETSSKDPATEAEEDKDMELVSLDSPEKLAVVVTPIMPSHAHVEVIQQAKGSDIADAVPEEVVTANNSEVGDLQDSQFEEVGGVCDSVQDMVTSEDATAEATAEPESKDDALDMETKVDPAEENNAQPVESEKESLSEEVTVTQDSVKDKVTSMDMTDETVEPESVLNSTETKTVVAEENAAQQVDSEETQESPAVEEAVSVEQETNSVSDNPDEPQAAEPSSDPVPSEETSVEPEPSEAPAESQTPEQPSEASQTLEQPTEPETSNETAQEPPAEVQSQDTEDSSRPSLSKKVSFCEEPAQVLSNKSLKKKKSSSKKNSKKKKGKR